MKLSKKKLEKLIANSDFEGIINSLKDVVQSETADFYDYFYFVFAVSSFYDKSNYPLAYLCFVWANLLKDKDEKMLSDLYLKVLPIILALGIKFFNEKNTNNIEREFYLQARFIIFAHSSKNNDALNTINTLIEEFPSVGNYMQRSKIYSIKKNYKAALNDLNKAIELNPRNSELYFNRALLNQKLKKINNAFIDFDMSININPNNQRYYYSRGLLQESVERYKNAIDDFKKVLQFDEKNIDAYNEIAWCNYKLLRYIDAISFVNMSIDINKNSANSYYIRGTIKNHIKDYEEARADLEYSVKLDNVSDKLWTSKILYQKAWAEFKLENYEQAQKDILLAIKYSNRCVTYFLLAMDIEFFGLKNYFNAKDYCKEALNLEPENPRALIAKDYIMEALQSL